MEPLVSIVPPIDVTLAQNKQPSPGPPATADGRKVAAAAAPARSEPTNNAISLICCICRPQGPLLAATCTGEAQRLKVAGYAEAGAQAI